MTANQRARGPGLGVTMAYGLGAVSAGVLTQSLTVLALLFYNQVVGLSPVAVGMALLISLIFDACWDPAIGLWSDNIRSRLGRRHPFMYASILPAGIFFWLLWAPPAGLSEQGAFAWLVAMLLGARFFSSLNEVPSTALAPELAPDYHVRTGLLGLRYFWAAMSATGIVIVAFQLFLSARQGGVTNRAGYAEFGLFGAVLIVATLLISCLGTQRAAAAFAPPPAEPVRVGTLLNEIRIAAVNRNFLALMMASLFGSVSSGLTNALTTYFNLYLWGFTTDQLSLLAMAGLIASVLSVILAPIASRLWGKKPAALGLYVLTAVVGTMPMALRLLGVLPGNDWPWLVPLLFVESTIAYTTGLMVLIILTSMMADVVEDNAVKSGRRSEGLIFSVNGLLAKCVLGLGALIAGVMLTTVGFPKQAAPGQVPVDTIHALGALYLPVALILSSLSVLALTRFRIDQAAHERNLAQLRVLAGADGPDIRSED